MALERNGAGLSLRSYLYGLGPVSMTSATQPYYFHRDALGSIVNLTSAAGQTEWTSSYEPFGSARTETKNNPVAPDNVLRFTGELRDSESGLYDLRDVRAERRTLPLPRPAAPEAHAAVHLVYARPTVLTGR